MKPGTLTYNTWNMFSSNDSFGTFYFYLFKYEEALWWHVVARSSNDNCNTITHKFMAISEKVIVG